MYKALSISKYSHKITIQSQRSCDQLIRNLCIQVPDNDPDYLNQVLLKEVNIEKPEELWPWKTGGFDTCCLNHSSIADVMFQTTPALNDGVTVCCSSKAYSTPEILIEIPFGFGLFFFRTRCLRGAFSFGLGF